MIAGGVWAVWSVVTLTGLATFALKGLGPVLLGGRSLPPRVLGLLELLAPALLAALVVTQVFEADERLVVDERLPGLLVAAVALRLHAPVLVVIVLGAATTALIRAFS